MILFQAFVLLGWLAILGHSPILALALGIIIVAWPLLKFIGEFMLGGWAAGIGLRLSGFGQPTQAHRYLAIWLLFAGAALIWLAMK